MLQLKGIYKTFNAGTVNEKRAIDNLNLTLEEMCIRDRVSAGAFLMLCRKPDFVVYCNHLKKSTARRKTVWRILYRIIYLAGRR